MKFIVSTANLAQALKRASRCVGNGRTGHPILATVLLKASGDTLTVCGFDLTTAISLTIPAAVQAQGSTAINSQVLTDLVTALPDNLPLSIELADPMGQAVISCGSSSYRVAAQVAADYPELPIPQPADPLVSVNAAAFIAACHLARGVVSTDESKGIIAGASICLDTNGGYEIAATDGHRLIQIGNLAEYTAQVVAHSRTLQQLEKFPADDSLTVIISSGIIHFLSADQTLSGRTIDGTYPNYRQLFPSNFKGDLQLNRQQLRSAVQRASIIARNSNDVVKLKPDADAGILQIAADNDTGAAAEQLNLSSCSTPCEFAVNHHYLTDALDAFTHDEVTFNLVSPIMPIVIEPSDSEQQVQPIRCLVMPVQVRETPAPKASKAKAKA